MAFANARKPGATRPCPYSIIPAHAETAFVFAGGGSFGAIQVGMLHSLAAHGISADMVVGSSVGRLTARSMPAIRRCRACCGWTTIWRALHRHDVFPVTWKTLLGFLWRRDFLIPHDGIRKLIDDHIPLSQSAGRQASGSYRHHRYHLGRERGVVGRTDVAEAIVASTAIPGAFAPVRYKDLYLADGAISCNTPIRVAVQEGAKRLIILPTGMPAQPDMPPVGAVANALHALTLLIARQLVSELESLGPDIEYFVVPPLCPLVGSPYDFSRTVGSYRARDPESPMRGWRKAGWNRAEFPTRCGRTRTERSTSALP